MIDGRSNNNDPVEPATRIVSLDDLRRILAAAAAGSAPRTVAIGVLSVMSDLELLAKRLGRRAATAARGSATGIAGCDAGRLYALEHRALMDAAAAVYDGQMRVAKARSIAKWVRRSASEGRSLNLSTLERTMGDDEGFDLGAGQLTAGSR